MSSGLYIPDNLKGYVDLWKWICSLKEKDNMDGWQEAMRYYCLNDLFFLLNFVSSDGKVIHSATLGTPTPKKLFFHDFYLEMCKLNQYYIDNGISSFDGSARRGGKSTIRTKLGSIQLGLRNPDISIGIFSVEKQLAENHIRLIKEELQGNKTLQVLFPDVLYEDPQMAAKNGETVWAVNAGLRFKRSRVRPNQTIEHAAFYGTSPTGSGYDVIHFDDCENEKVTASQDAISKLHDSVGAAVNLATPSVLPDPIFFFTNTFYHPEGIAKKRFDMYSKSDPKRVRVVPGEDLTIEGDGPMGGVAVYPFTTKLLWDKFNESSKESYAIQYCCDFRLASDRSFKRDWVQFYDDDPTKIMRGKNSYICIDASKGVYDPMGIWIWSVGTDKKLYWTGGSRKKLDPASPGFFDEIFTMYNIASNFSDRVVEIRVEQQTQQTWAELIKSELAKRGCWVSVIPCRGKLGKEVRKFNTAKLDREWSRWAPALQRGDIVIPRPQSLGGRGLPTQDERGKPFDLVDYFLEFEYDLFPRSPHDDLLDAGALLWDIEAAPIEFPSIGYKKYNNYSTKSADKTSWMSAGG